MIPRRVGGPEALGAAFLKNVCVSPRNVPKVEGRLLGDGRERALDLAHSMKTVSILLAPLVAAGASVAAEVRSAGPGRIGWWAFE